MNKFRFFYAPEYNRTWPKLFVLADDGTFYCEYLYHNNRTKFIEQQNFATFDAKAYRWKGYQALQEITFFEAIQKRLIKQDNWIHTYTKDYQSTPFKMNDCPF